MDDDPPIPKRRKGSNMTQRRIRSSKAGKFRWPKGSDEKAFMFAHLLMDHPELKDTLAYEIRNTFTQGV